MKQIYPFLLFICVGNVVLAQDYLEKIAEKACECVTNVDTTLGREEYTMKFGLCVIEEAQPYAKKLKKDHDIDFEHIDRDGNKLGTLIALRMSRYCAAELMALSERVKGKTISEQMDEKMDGKVIKSFTGSVQTIAGEQFITFSIKDKNNIIHHFIWLYTVKSNVDLAATYKSLEGKQVEIDYQTVDLFDSKAGEYKTYKMITSIEVN